MINDRNFDDIAEHFEKKVALSRKGRLRRKVILKDLAPQLASKSSLRLLDVGAGLGQLAIHFASQHSVSYLDVSEQMMHKAQQLAELQNLKQQIEWYNLPYQTFFNQNIESFDLIFCHAVLEWVAEPKFLIDSIAASLNDQGVLSLCFYNPAGRDMRNLVMGNFKLLEREGEYRPDSGSLTPLNPCSLDQVEQWLSENKLTVQSLSGIRVFSDYVSHRRGGLASEEEIETMELRYSGQEPFNRIGRYLHIVARKER